MTFEFTEEGNAFGDKIGDPEMAGAQIDIEFETLRAERDEARAEANKWRKRMAEALSVPMVENEKFPWE